MQTDKTKDNGSKTEGTDYSFCDPDNFQKMFEKMGRCFAGQDNIMDCSCMTDGMMNKMMGMCCPPHTNNLREKTKNQKDQGA